MTNSSFASLSEPKTQLTQLPLLQMGNELNSDLKLAAQIVLGLVILIITLLLALSRFQQVELVLERISEAVGTLVRIVTLLQQFQQVVSVLELIDVVGSLVNQLLRLIRTCREIWSIWTTGQPSANANDGQNEESNI
nr:hypothetical protein CFP56_02057 [Quercus suber]